MTKILLNFESKSLLNSLSERLQFEEFATLEIQDSAEAKIASNSADVDVAIVSDSCDITELNIPTIVVAKSPSIDSAIQALRSGAIDYLSIPIDMNRLLETLRNIENLSSRQQTTQQHCALMQTVAKQFWIVFQRAVGALQTTSWAQASSLLPPHPTS